MKKYFLLILPIIGGFVISLFTNITNNSFLPSILFPIVWTILYILMGVSSYMVSLQNGDLTIYYIQLILNYLWPIIYFNFDLKLLALFILIILILLVIKMINQFKKYKFSHLLQIPYLIWLFVALFLNILSIFK